MKYLGYFVTVILIRTVMVCGKNTPETDYAYQLGMEPMNWMDAKYYCHEQGLVLATIHSNAEQTAAWRTCGGHSCWLGLTDHIREGKWKWLDNKDYDPMNTYWRIGEPNNYNNSEDCAIMWGQDALNNSKDGPWNDVNCDLGPKGTMIEIYPLCRNVKTCVPDCVSPNQCDGAPDGCGGRCGNTCQMYSRGPVMKWHAAKHYCESLGTRLATIETMVEQGKANDACGGVNCWIGATDEIIEGHWIWAQDEKYLDPEQTYWAPGEPNNWMGPEDCACLYNDGLGILPVQKPGYWADANCGTPMYALCKNPVKEPRKKDVRDRHYEVTTTSLLKDLTDLLIEEVPPMDDETHTGDK